MFMGLNENALKEAGGLDTAREILQQPSVFGKVYSALQSQEEALAAFLDRVYRFEKYRIILTGAGSSEFIGTAVAAQAKAVHENIVSVGTTSLITSPHIHFSDPMLPTLLVSFARSGNSPESVACAELAETCLNNIFHLIITCNKDGALSMKSGNLRNAYVLPMPDETNDKGFAMTSSVTSMILSAYIALSKKNVSFFGKDTDLLKKISGDFLQAPHPELLDLARKNCGRIVYLGSDNLKATAQESALKVLELTNGEIATVFETPMAFRHGPKTFINHETLTFLFFTANPHTNAYDKDVLRELYSDDRGNTVISVVNSQDNDIKNNSHYYFGLGVNDGTFSNDIFLSIVYLIFAQAFAFLKSHYLGYNTDSPCADNSVNRVVQGVTIYGYGKS